MNPIKPTIKTEFFSALMLLIMAALSVFFYLNFPETVPTHWNYKGEIDAYSSKGFGAFFMPIFTFGLYILFLCLPYFDPNKDRYQEFSKVYQTFKNLFLALMTFIYILTGLAGLGYPVDVGLLIPASIGVFFIILGNYFGKIKQNWFFGIKTPWTLSNEEVWNKTHRFGGKVFILVGLFLIFGTLLPKNIFWIFFIVFVIFGSLIPVIYSYFIFKKIKEKETK